jgi:hypothetical protein
MPVTTPPDRTEPDALTDEELSALALAADPDVEVDADAVSLWELTGGPADGPLPDWYMPAAAGGRLLSGWRRIPVGLVIAALLVINCYGLCNTYGQLGFT